MASVFFTLPSSSLFKLPPHNDPQTLPPPIAGSTLSAPPFSISPTLYNALLDIKVPITIACVYAATVTSLNAYNRSRGNRPWAISKTKPFFWFVVAHNILLAVYSAWTFVGIVGTMKRAVSSPFGPSGLAGTVDSLCKMHGITGLGNAIAYTPQTSSFVSQSPNVFLTSAGTPNATDLGRIWNEGLAFYGWFFYLSKFYEVLDTAIILAKGKRSSTLQTYHHAGAMMCMWAGIRYMAPPIWLFVYLNSAIHSLMYTYYTLTAFEIYIPQRMKRGLTTMQICQFIFGVAYATLHSFVSYTIPAQASGIVASAAGIVSAASSAVSSGAASATSAGAGSLFKKALFRAAGEEGLAENVDGKSFNFSKSASSMQHFQPTYQTVSCIATSGQTFAIWLNVFYLVPLMVLFMRFFVKSYMRRTSNQGSTKHGASEKAAKDAIKGVTKELYSNRHGDGSPVEETNGKH